MFIHTGGGKNLMTKALGVYVGKDGLANFEVGLGAGTWGWRERWAEPSALAQGDLIIIAYGGGGRIKIDQWMENFAGSIALGRITRIYYSSNEPLWPDEKAGEAKYPYRVDFELLARSTHVPFRHLPLSVNKLFQTSATKPGRGFFTEISQDTQAEIIDALSSSSIPTLLAASPGAPNVLQNAIERVLALQHSYSSENTQSMQERGLLVRTDLPEALRGKVGDFAVEGRDATGLKSRVPWVRIFDPDCSPSATSGYYAVFLFSADGCRAVLSLNQGTTNVVNGSFPAKPPEQISELKNQARALLGARLDGLEQTIDLADSGKLGAGYERGHIAGWSYDAGEIPSDDMLLQDLGLALDALRVLYGQGPRNQDHSVTPAAAGPTPDIDMAWLERMTLRSRTDLEAMIESLQTRAPQIVLAGPPGTGKTWLAKNLAAHITGGRPEAVLTVQLHPSYGYEDFVVGLRPVASKGGITFDEVEGPLVIAADLARSVSHPVVLLLDEMNRANLPRVFGELMYLLEYRDESIRLMQRESFSLPSNLYVIATMNTADRSIRSIDTALRRRFDIFDCPPDAGILDRYYSAAGENEVLGLADGMSELNRALTDELDRHHTIGHTFFMRRRFTAADLQRTWERQIHPLIEEYFFDQPDRIEDFGLHRFWST